MLLPYMKPTINTKFRKQNLENQSNKNILYEAWIAPKLENILPN